MNTFAEAGYYPKSNVNPFVSEDALRIGPDFDGPNIHPSVVERLSGRMNPRTMILLELLQQHRTLSRAQIGRVLFPNIAPRTMKDALKRMESSNFIVQYHWGINGEATPTSMATPTYTLTRLGMMILRSRGAHINPSRLLLPTDLKRVWKILLSNELWSHLVLHRLAGDQRRLQSFNHFQRITLSNGTHYTPAAAFAYTHKEGTKPRRFILDVVRGPRDVDLIVRSFDFYMNWFEERPEFNKTFVIVVCEDVEQAFVIKQKLIEAGTAAKVRHLFTTDMLVHSKLPGELGFFFDVHNENILEQESVGFRVPEEMYF